MSDISEKQLSKFLKELMDIQRRYANEDKNKTSKRQADIKDLLEKLVARETSNEN
jgi:predicted metal-dependent enzyme (double-stranded beta helix superfamily)